MLITTVFLFTSCFSMAASEVTDPVKRGLDYLVSIQAQDGSFKYLQPGVGDAIRDRDFTIKHGNHYMLRATTAFSVMALLARGDAKYDAVARKGLEFLAKKQVPSVMDYTGYAHGYVAIALVEGTMRWKEAFRPAAEKAVQFIVDNESYWLSRQRHSTYKGSLMLDVLYFAHKAGLKVPEATLKNARRKVDRHFNDKTNWFGRHSNPNIPSYSGTTIAVAVLERCGEKDSKLVATALSSLAGMPIDEIVNKEELWPLDLFYHGMAYLYAKDAKLLQDLMPAVRKRLFAEQAKDGSWDAHAERNNNNGFTTSIICLILQLDKAPQVAWIKLFKNPKYTK